MADNSSEKTEKATPKRRQDQRKKGNVFQGRDITIAFSILIMFTAFKILGQYIYKFLLSTYTYFIGQAAYTREITVGNLPKLTLNVVGSILIMVLPLLIISAAVAVIFSGVQTKFIFNFKSIKFKLERLNPLNGFRRLLSIRNLLQTVKSLVMVTAIGVFLYIEIKDFLDSLVSFYTVPVPQAVVVVASATSTMFIKLSIIIIFIGIIDYFIQWWQYEKSIRMTKQEVKDEMKQTDGDPLVKSEIRGRQRKLASARMMQKVPEADVVIVNPKHYAVALKYDSEVNSAPVVVAKGVDNIALKIKEIAKANYVRIEENPPLARALYKACELDQEIPPEFYQAVAEILSYVYSMKRYY